MQTYKYDFEKQLQNWLKINNVDESTEFIIQASKDSDYSDTNKIDFPMQFFVEKFGKYENSQ